MDSRPVGGSSAPSWSITVALSGSVAGRMIAEVRNAVQGYKKHSPFEQDI